MSRELILSMSVSMDGFVAGPNGEIDWMFASRSEASTQWLVERLAQMGLIAMGHQSYLGMADFWPTSNKPFAGPMNEIPKAVFSRKGAITPPSMEKTMTAVGEGVVSSAVLESWQRPIVTGMDLVGDIERLKAEGGKPINALGGASFASSLVTAKLVDLFRLAVHPVVLGRGLPIFAGLESPLRFKLEDLQTFETGAVIKTYRPLYQ